MAEDENVAAFLAKALESLETAESEYVNRRYNSCANRCYCACFQAAIAALVRAGIGPRHSGGRWGHDYVQAAFAGHLVNRRKIYPPMLSDTLTSNRAMRETADYKPETVTQKQAERALRRSREFLQAVRKDQGERQ